MPRSREGWLSTIRAISEMTEAHGCTKAEAVTARVKAFELMYKKGISMRDLMAPVSIVVPQASVTPEPCDPGRRTAYEYWEKHGIRSDPFMSQVFSNERGMNPLQRIARIVEVDKPAEAHSSLRAVRRPQARADTLLGSLDSLSL
jgi:hypothetical protein